ncbi:hypothetical protein RchiOBHm_Chr0c25g0500871 [Rosa chinensis]|uniref:Uncharacterized protein n=1 Tax=Rosa chinensis TaxID=74649 RepID=A0A2P6SQF6_ROSCH|nr:hypothetical protein RchiOBHm_Chr0c25g0500871 [Rosa chinensis]
MKNPSWIRIPNCQLFLRSLHFNFPLFSLENSDILLLVVGNVAWLNSWKQQ